MPDDKEIASINDGLAEAMAFVRDEPLEREGERQQPPPRESDGGGEEKPATAPPSDDPPRDDHGRFAPREQGEPEKPPGEEERDGGQVPSWRMREIREERDRMAQERDAYRRQAWELEQRQQAWERQQKEAWQAQQQQYQAPDPINDPQGWNAYVEQIIDRRVQGVMQRAENDRVNWTFARAHREHGEAFDKAISMIKGHPHADQVVADIRASVDPGEAMWQWGRQQMAIAEYGEDPGAFKQKHEAELIDSPDFRKKAMERWTEQARGPGNGQFSDGNVRTLPSVNRAPGGAGRQQPGQLGESDGEIYANLSAADRNRSRR